MRTYKIEVEETVLVAYWIDADSEEQVRKLWQDGDFAEWDRHVKEQNDELISIEIQNEMETAR